MRVPMNVTYLGHREINIDGDIVYFVRINVTGDLVLEADEKYLEAMVCEVFVQKSETPSGSPQDLRRVALRKLNQLIENAKTKVRAEAA